MLRDHSCLILSLHNLLPWALWSARTPLELCALIETNSRPEGWQRSAGQHSPWRKYCCPALVDLPALYCDESTRLSDQSTAQHSFQSSKWLQLTTTSDFRWRRTSGAAFRRDTDTKLQCGSSYRAQRIAPDLSWHPAILPDRDDRADQQVYCSNQE